MPLDRRSLPNRFSRPTSQTRRRKNRPVQPDAAIERLEERALLTRIVALPLDGPASDIPELPLNWCGTVDPPQDGSQDPLPVRDPDPQAPTPDGPNAPPVAVSFTQMFYEGWGLFGGSEQWLQVAVLDPDGDRLTYELVSGPDVGQGSLDSAGWFHWSPPGVGYSGTFSFTYRAFDGEAYSDSATVTISVIAQSTPELITPQTAEFTGSADSPVTGTVSSGGVAHFILEVTSRPQVGILALNPSTGEFVYTPPAGFTGSVSFTYQTWPLAFAEPSTVTITIEASADDPASDPGPWISVAEPPVAPPEAGDSLGGDFGLYFQIASASEGGPAAIVIASTDTFDARQVNAESLTLRSIAPEVGGFDGGQAGVARYRYEDVNGDGRDDLIAVFELDWTALWDGAAAATVFGESP